MLTVPVGAIRPSSEIFVSVAKRQFNVILHTVSSPSKALYIALDVLRAVLHLDQ